MQKCVEIVKQIYQTLKICRKKFGNIVNKTCIM